jgi:FlaA1/EpsC-like NDP-sugar epimerase
MIHDLIKLSGFEPGKDIEIVTIGIRPGDRLYEELLTPEEGTVASKHEKITIVKQNRIGSDSLNAMLSSLEELCQREELTPAEVIKTVASATKRA